MPNSYIHKNILIMIKYLRHTAMRMQDALSVLRKMEKELVSKETKKNMRRIRMTIFVGTIILMVTPWVFGELVDRAIATDTPWVTSLLAIVISLVILRIWINQRTNLRIEKNYGDTRMNTDRIIGRQFVKKNIKQLQTEQALSIANIAMAREYVNNIIGDIRIGITRVSADLAVAYLATMVGAVAFKMPLIGVTATIGLIVALLLSAYLNTKVIEDTKDIEADFRAYNRQYEEMIEKLSSFKAQGMDRKLLSQNEAQYQDIFRKDRKFWFWYIGRSQLRELIISVFVIIGAYIIGVYQIMTRPESLPLVIALFSWGGIQAASLRELARLERSLNKRLPSIVSFFEALELEPTREESGRRRFNKNEPFDISFENISHSYEDGKPALENINFTIKSGEKWAFVGESGSGKTTLVNLILGAMPPTKGSIYIIPHLTREKIDLWDVDLHWWRSEVLGYVPQDVVLKDGSLRENLLLAVPETQPEPTDAELMKVLERFNAVFRGHHDTSFLDIEVGRDGGIELSGGQRQRIGIARAVLKNASFLIFDEATSSLDARLTNSVTSAFKDALSPTTTSILIAHDLSTVAGGNPSKLINIGTDSNDLVCSHYMVLRPIEKSVINLSQVDYAGPWQGLVESEVMQELITESQRENLVDN